MATIAEMQSSMTLYYSKSSGDIKAFCTGIQDMSFFGSDSEDYSIIWDFVVLPLDNNVLDNFKNFTINLTTKQLEIKSSAVPQYPVAST